MSAGWTAQVLWILCYFGGDITRGGLTVKIGSRLIDASLRTKLQSMKLAMKEVG